MTPLNDFLVTVVLPVVGQLVFLLGVVALHLRWLNRTRHWPYDTFLRAHKSWGLQDRFEIEADQHLARMRAGTLTHVAGLTIWMDTCLGFRWWEIMEGSRFRWFLSRAHARRFVALALKRQDFMIGSGRTSYQAMCALQTRSHRRVVPEPAPPA